MNAECLRFSLRQDRLGARVTGQNVTEHEGRAWSQKVDPLLALRHVKETEIESFGSRPRRNGFATKHRCSPREPRFAQEQSPRRRIGRNGTSRRHHARRYLHGRRVLIGTSKHEHIDTRLERRQVFDGCIRIVGKRRDWRLHRRDRRFASNDDREGCLDDDRQRPRVRRRLPRERTGTKGT